MGSKTSPPSALVFWRTILCQTCLWVALQRDQSIFFRMAQFAARGVASVAGLGGVRAFATPASDDTARSLAPIGASPCPTAISRRNSPGIPPHSSSTLDDGFGAARLERLKTPSV